MKDHPAQHYLRIYRLKLGMAEDGTTRSSAAGLEFFKFFVSALEGLDPDTPVKLETNAGVARFTDARSGLLLAELTVEEDV